MFNQFIESDYADNESGGLRCVFRGGQGQNDVWVIGALRAQHFEPQKATAGEPRGLVGE